MKFVSTLSESLFKGALLAVAELFEDSLSCDLIHPDTDDADECHEFAACFVHRSATQASIGVLGILIADRGHRSVRWWR